MKRTILVLALFIGLNFGSPNLAIAAGGGSSCFSLGIPTVSSSSDEIVVSVSIRSSCERPFGLSSGGPVYTISEESILTSSCEGPYDLSLFTSGTVTCKIKIGGSLGSSRSGAISSTLKVWFAYDSGTKTTTFSHPQIPSKSSGSGSSGSSSGSTSNGSVLPKSCTKAPEVPVLKVSWNQTGPLFEFEPAASGDRATVLDWNYVLYDSQSSSWGTWSKWNEIYPAGVGSYQAQEIPGKTKIAFSVYATNACGSSEQAREISTHIGVPLTGARQDTLRRIFPESKRIQVGDIYDIYGIVSSELLIPLVATSSTPDTCYISSTGNVQMLEAGICNLRFSSKTLQQNIGASNFEVSLVVSQKKQSQVISLIQLKEKYEITQQSLKFESVTDANLAIVYESLSTDICGVLGSTVYFLKVGTCQIKASQPGNETTEAAVSQEFIMEIADSRASLTCIKGKNIRKVTGLKPKCPSGYKVKK